MSRYDDLYIFRESDTEDIDKIMAFIKKYWRNDHILGKNRDFFLYEHANNKKINFIICEDRNTREIIGIHGFIPYSHNMERLHVCGVMTMVRKDVAVPMLGVELIKQFINIIKYKTYCGIGTNPTTMVPLVKRLFNRYVYKMEHYYMLNDKIENFKIAVSVDRKVNKEELFNSESTRLINFKSFNEVERSFDLNKSYQNLPFKEGWYINKRYFNHPIYRYKVWGVSQNNNIIALLFGRVVEQEKHSIIRFVDYIGEIDDLVYAGEGIKDMIEVNNYEYADFLLHGVPEIIMNKTGFVRKQKDDKNIIPNYFEPFVQQNVEIWCETSNRDMILFKGDADADRPNFY